MKKKPKKTPARSAKTTSQNQFGVILEDIKGKFDFLIERQDASEEKNKNNFKLVFQYLSRIEDELMSVKAEIADIKKTLTQKADKDRVALLEERVAKLERQLAQTLR